MMRRWLVAFAFLVTTGPAIASEPSRPDTWVAEAAPLIDRALTQPMPDLYEAAKRGEVNDMLVMGLAQLAGRLTDAEVTQSDRDTLDALETRIEPAFTAFVEQDPSQDLSQVTGSAS